MKNILVFILCCGFLKEEPQSICYKIFPYNNSPKCIDNFKKLADTKILQMSSYYAILQHRVDSIFDNNKNLENKVESNLILSKLPFSQNDRKVLFGDLHDNQNILQFVAVLNTQQVKQSIIESKNSNKGYQNFYVDGVLYEDISDSLYYQISEAIPIDKKTQYKFKDAKLYYIQIIHSVKIDNDRVANVFKEKYSLDLLVYCSEEEM